MYSAGLIRRAPGLVLLVFAVVLSGSSPNLVAQTSRAIVPAESLKISDGEIIYLVGAWQSNVNGGPTGNFGCTVQLGFSQIEIGLNPFRMGPEGNGPAVLAGPAELKVSSDSIVTYFQAQDSGARSVVFGPGIPAVIQIEANKSCALFGPLSKDGYMTRSITAQVEMGGVSLTNVAIFPPTQIQGPATITLRASNPTIATFKIGPKQTAVVAQPSGVQSVVVESSTNLVSWTSVFSTNLFHSSQGFFRLRTGD